MRRVRQRQLLSWLHAQRCGYATDQRKMWWLTWCRAWVILISVYSMHRLDSLIIFRPRVRLWTNRLSNDNDPHSAIRCWFSPNFVCGSERLLNTHWSMKPEIRCLRKKRHLLITFVSLSQNEPIKIILVHGILQAFDIGFCTLVHHI